MNLYDILGVEKDAPKSKIKKAYKNLVMKYHPDKNKDPNAVEKFKEIQYAWEILSDDSSRKKYDMMTNDQKIVLYEILKQYFSKIAPNYIDAYNDLVKKYYGDEKDLKDDLNNLDIKKIYNKVLLKIRIDIEANKNIEDEIPIYNKKISKSTIDLNIYSTIYTTLKEKYLNKYKKISVKRISTNSDTSYIIPLRESQIIIPGAGEIGEDDTQGDIIIDIVCNDEFKIKRQNNNDIIITKYISLYEYLYGGEVKIMLPDDTIYCHKFESCINKVSIFCIKNKGMPYVLENDNYIEISKSSNVKRGNMFIYLKIDGIENDDESSLSLKYSQTVENIIKAIFPPLN